MLNKLTPDQVKLMEETKNEWINHYLHSGYETDYETMRPLIDWTYAKIGLPAPLILIADGYVSQKLMTNYAIDLLSSLAKNSISQVGDQIGNQNRKKVVNQVVDQLREQVGSQVGDQIGSQVREQVGSQVWDQVGNQVGNQVERQVGRQVESQVWEQVGDQVKDQVRDQVWNKVGSPVRVQVRSQVRDQVWSQVRDQVGRQVGSQVWDQVGNQVGNEVGRQVREQVESQVWDQVGNITTKKLDFHEQFFGVWDAGWISFYDFFEKIGILKSDEFSKYRELQRQAFSIVMFESFVVVCKLPKKTHVSDHGLHSTNGPCIEWRDGINTSYFIHGVDFGDDKNLFDDGSKLYKKVIERKLTPKQLLEIENTDQRFIAINHYGFGKMINEMNPTLIDTGKYGNKLMNVMINDMEVRLLTYPDIDGNGERTSFVDPSLTKADDAMAWKHNCTIDEYYSMEVLQSWDI